MKPATAESLVLAIANAVKISLDAQNKLKAFENVLKKQDQKLYTAYRDELARIRKNPPASLSVQGLQDLQAGLVQD
jgi:hypothetical protein